MKKLIVKLIRKKNKGQSDLICSLFVITALIAILFIAVRVVTDISKITLVDQVARQGVIKLETNGKLSSTELSNIKTTLENSNLKFDSSHTLKVNGKNISDGVYVAYKDSSGKWKIDTSNNHSFGYGEEIAIYIQCQAKTLSFGGDIFGSEEAEDVYTTITRLKASITKTAN